MKLRLWLLMLCFVPALAQAQPLAVPIPIHGHPQLAAYTDTSQFPTIAAHLNWAPGENPVASQAGSDGVLDIVAGRLGNATLGHLHLDLIKCPIWAEIAGPITCRFQVLLYNVQGQAFVNPDYQNGIRDMVWDATGTATAPAMIGALGEERTWQGSFVIDPTGPSQFPTKHGWWNPTFTAVIRLANGDTLDKELWASFYSVVDPHAPETDGVPFLSARISPHENRHGENWGSNIVETLRGTPQYLPLVPLKPGEVFHTIFATNGYGADNLPTATAERRDGSDIHHHLGGTVVDSITQTKTINIDAAFDADAMGPGTHKIIIGRRQVGLFGDQAVVTQLVFTVNVAAPAPPPTCQDHTATNFGGPLPCLYPPHVFIWQSFGLGTWNVSFEREVDQTIGTATGRTRACIGTQCLVIEKP